MPQENPNLNSSALRRLLLLSLVLLVPVAWFSMRFDPYAIDGDAVAYMDIADLLHTHQWAGAVNAYWHPLYPAMLLLGQILFHPTRFTELDAYYKINFLILLLQAAAVLAFTAAIARLRDGMAMRGTLENAHRPFAFLLSANALRMLGIGLLVIASQRELTLGKVRPDGLLQALLLFGFAAMLQLCSASLSTGANSNLPLQHRYYGPRDSDIAAQHESAPAGRAGSSIALNRAAILHAALMGLAFGLAYLTKSFAFLVALLSIAAVTIFQYLWLKRPALQSIFPGAVALLVFAMVAGPYIAALSHQKHRLDFGDSGSLNYAWYVAGTDKFHLEPWQANRFGSADVHLIHPERQLLASPGIYSYKQLPYGTIPPWFDASFFNERIVTHIHLGQLARRDARNLVLVFRYLLNHPEAWLLFGLLLFLGARLHVQLRGDWRRSFWVLPVFLGCAVWAIYGLVNVEERYVTFGYLVLVLPLFAALEDRRSDPPDKALREADTYSVPAYEARTLLAGLPGAATVAVVLLALLSLGDSVRIAAENRRTESLRGMPRGWYDPTIFTVAKRLQQMGVRPGDEIACIGTVACVYDPYWMRLAGARTTTEIFMDHDHLAESLSALPNRDEAYRTVQREGAKVLVGHFDAGRLASSGTVANGWQPLGDTGFFALPLNLPDRSGAAPGAAQ